MAAHAAAPAPEETFDLAAVSKRLDALLGGKLSVSIGDSRDGVELTATHMHPTASYMLVQRTTVAFQGEPVNGHYISVRHMVEEHGLRQMMEVTEGGETRSSYPIELPDLFERGIRSLEQPPAAGAALGASPLGDLEFMRSL